MQNELHAKDPVQFPTHGAHGIQHGAEAAPILIAAGRGELRLRAFYHSHPDHDAYFSAEDHTQALGGGDEPSYPDAAHIVMSVRNRAVQAIKAFAWDASARDFVEIALTVDRWLPFRQRLPSLLLPRRGRSCAVVAGTGARLLWNDRTGAAACPTGGRCLDPALCSPVAGRGRSTADCRRDDPCRPWHCPLFGRIGGLQRTATRTAVFEPAPIPYPPRRRRSRPLRRRVCTWSAVAGRHRRHLSVGGGAAQPDDRVRHLYAQAIDQLLRIQIEGTRQREPGCIAFQQAFDERLFLWEFEHFIEYGIEMRLGRPVPTRDAEVLRTPFAASPAASMHNRATSPIAIFTAGTSSCKATGSASSTSRTPCWRPRRTIWRRCSETATRRGSCARRWSARYWTTIGKGGTNCPVAHSMRRDSTTSTSSARCRRHSR